MSTPPPKGPSRADLKRARREAEKRQQAWETLRAQQGAAGDPAGAAPQYPTFAPPSLADAPPPMAGTAAAETLHPSAYAPMPLSDGESLPSEQPEATGLTSPWAQALLPVLTAVALIVTISIGFPVMGQPLRPLPAVLGLLFTGGAAWLWRDSWATAARWKPRIAGTTVAALLAVSFIAGLLNQVVVDGRPQLVGSVQERTYRTAERLLNDARVVAENQKLLRLSPEQANTLLPLFDEAIAQDASIAARWNPATAGTPPTPGLREAYQRLNAAAGYQAAALQAQKQNLLSPDQKLAAQAAERYQLTDQLVGAGPGSVQEAVNAAFAEVQILTPTASPAPTSPAGTPSAKPSASPSKSSAPASTAASAGGNR